MKKAMSVGMRVEELGFSCIVGGNVQYWKTVGPFFQMLNLELPHGPAAPPLGIYPREAKLYVHTGLVHEYS